MQESAIKIQITLCPHHCTVHTCRQIICNSSRDPLQTAVIPHAHLPPLTWDFFFLIFWWPAQRIKQVWKIPTYHDMYVICTCFWSRVDQFIISPGCSVEGTTWSDVLLANMKLLPGCRSSSSPTIMAPPESMGNDLLPNSPFSFDRDTRTVIFSPAARSLLTAGCFASICPHFFTLIPDPGISLCCCPSTWVLSIDTKRASSPFCFLFGLGSPELVEDPRLRLGLPEEGTAEEVAFSDEADRKSAAGIWDSFCRFSFFFIFVSCCCTCLGSGEWWERQEYATSLCNRAR